MGCVDLRLDELRSLPHDNDNELAIASFEMALKILNHYLRAYSIGAEDPAVRLLTPEALQVDRVGVQFLPQDLDARPHNSSFDLGVVGKTERLFKDNRLLLRRVQQGMLSTTNGHPMDDVILWKVRAEHHANYVGDYELSVVALQTSIERQVFELRSCVLVDLGHDAASVKAALGEPFKTALQDLGRKLGGTPWNLTDVSSPAGRYWSDLYDLRNRVAHNGASVSRVTVERAFSAHREFVEDIEARLLKKKTKYPRTAILVFGGEGLRQHGELSNKMKEIIEGFEADGKHWSFWKPGVVK